MGTRMNMLAITVAAALGVAGVGNAHGDASPAPVSPSDHSPSAVAPSEPAAVAPFQVALLELAMESASVLPLDPFLKDRARAQEAVVAAWLDLDQPERALECAQRIGNWRRGAAYADIAFHQAERGRTSTVLPLLALAELISDEEDNWRRDRVRVKAARTHALIGSDDRALALEAGVVAAEAGKVDGVRASLVGTDGLDERLRAIEESVATGGFDATRNALEAAVQLFDRFYADVERRSFVEGLIKSSWSKLPHMIRIELLMQLASTSLDHGDRPQAIDLLDEADSMLNESKWSAEHSVPLMGRLATLRARAGDVPGARRGAEAALARFDAERHLIVDMYRAGALRPVAEAIQAAGDTVWSQTVYRRALEAGTENPNARPRAVDLSRTCISLALAHVAPDASLWQGIEDARSRLVAPW